MDCWKRELICLCGVREAKQQSKARNFLCIGPIRCLSFSEIRDIHSVTVHKHKTFEHIHILTFLNGVRESNKNLWGHNRVISIKKRIPQCFVRVQSTSEYLLHIMRENNTIPNATSCYYVDSTDHVSSIPIEDMNAFTNNDSLGEMEQQREELENEKRKLIREIEEYKYKMVCNQPTYNNMY